MISLGSAIKELVASYLSLGESLGSLAPSCCLMSEQLQYAQAFGKVVLSKVTVATHARRESWLRWWWRAGVKSAGMSLRARSALSGLILDRRQEYICLMQAIVQGAAAHDLFVAGLHVAALRNWCGQTIRWLNRDTGLRIADLRWGGPCGSIFLVTDGPLPGKSLLFAITPLEHLNDTSELWPLVFRVGIFPWPPRGEVPVKASRFDMQRSATGDLEYDDFDIGHTILVVGVGHDQRLSLHSVSHRRLIETSLDPVVPSETGQYGVYIWYPYGRPIRFSLVDSPLWKQQGILAAGPGSPPYLYSPTVCPPMVSRGQHFRTRPAGSNSRCYAFTVHRWRMRFHSFLPPDFIFGPAADTSSREHTVDVYVAGLWYRIWCRGECLATPLPLS